MEDFFRGDFFGGFFWRYFFGGFFLGGFFWEDFLGGLFWEEILWEELLSRVLQGIDVFVKILGQARKKERHEFRYLEVQDKLIALKEHAD